MRDDMREPGALTPQSNTERDASDDVSAELAATHRALSDLASAWVATTPSAERLIAFTRQLPTQQAPADHPSDAPLSQRESAPRSHSGSGAGSGGGRRLPRGGRALAGLAAAIVIVGLLAATLLRLAPSHTGKITREQATATAAPSLPTARLAEEPSQQPPSGVWSTVAHAQFIPAPSDGSVVYRADGPLASISHDGGATWRTLTLPTFTQKTVLAASAYLRVSEADWRVVLLSMVLSVTSYGPGACPAGSIPPAPSSQLGMHGGVLASGQPYCHANFASHDGGATWAAMRLPSDVDSPPNSLDTAHVWQLGQSLYGLNIPAIFPSVLGSSVLVSHDLGVTWAYDNTSSPEASAHLCSFLPSAPNNALYALTTTAAQGCPNQNGVTHSILWRSDDGGATWNQISTFDSRSFTELVAATPTTTGHGVWLYAFQPGAKNSSVALVSADGGATWLQTPGLPPAGASDYYTATHNTLADGSMVVATIGWRGSSISEPPARATFYAWRPGDAAWRTLTTTLTTLTSSNGEDLVTLARGGPSALDTLWVVDAFENENPANATTYRYGIR